MKYVRLFIFACVVANAAAATLPLEVHSNGMAFVEAEVDGRNCRFLYDTGTTVTTLDIDFATNVLGKVSLGKATVMPGGNVDQVPDVIPVECIKLGGLDFKRKYVAAIGLKTLAANMNERFDGILGMDVIGGATTILSMKNAKVSFPSSKDDIAGFPPPRRSLANDALIFPAEKCGKTFPVLVDSGSSFTFFNTGLWPATDSAGLEASMTGANGRETREQKFGEKGRFDKGPQLELAPMIMDGRENTIGCDTLRRYDLLVAPTPDALFFSFRPAK